MVETPETCADLRKLLESTVYAATLEGSMTDTDDRPVGPSSWKSGDPLHPHSGPDVACPKCGGDVGVQWHPAGTRPVGGGVSIWSAGQPEWLDRTCRNCGYFWAESPADAEAVTRD